MARPIKETPILEGGDALRFIDKMNNVKKLPKEEIERMRKNHALFQAATVRRWVKMISR